MDTPDSCMSDKEIKRAFLKSITIFLLYLAVPIIGDMGSAILHRPRSHLDDDCLQNFEHTKWESPGRMVVVVVVVVQHPWNRKKSLSYSSKDCVTRQCATG